MVSCMVLLSCLVILDCMSLGVQSRSVSFRDNVESGGSAIAFGSQQSNSNFQSEANVNPGGISFFSGGNSEGLGNGRSNAFVEANGSHRRSGYLVSGGDIQSEGAAYGNLGSLSKGESVLESQNGRIRGRGEGSASGFGHGVAKAKSGSSLNAGDKYGLYSGGAGGFASGNGGFVGTESKSGTYVESGVGTGAYSQNFASSKGRGKTSANANSNANANNQRYYH